MSTSSKSALVACMCNEGHNAVRSRDVFLMKNDRGNGQGNVSDNDYLGSRWHEIACHQWFEDRPKAVPTALHIQKWSEPHTRSARA